jgi:hypothetical protein
LLNEPVPASLSGGDLRQYFGDQEFASRVLGEVKAREDVLTLKRNTKRVVLSACNLAAELGSLSVQPSLRLGLAAVSFSPELKQQF